MDNTVSRATAGDVCVLDCIHRDGYLPNTAIVECHGLPF
jgi:hypothetical protein